MSKTSTSDHAAADDNPKIRAAELLYARVQDLLKDWRNGVPNLARDDAESLLDACFQWERANEEPRLYYTVKNLAGESCTFDDRAAAERAALKIAEAEGWSGMETTKMRPSLFKIMPATNSSAKIAALGTEKGEQ